MKMKRLRTLCSSLLGALICSLALAQDDDATGNPAEAFADDSRATSGRALGYQQLDQASLERVTTPERLLRVAQGGFAPTEIWRAFEHGEKVECLDCIPYAARLLYDANAKTREISAWWLRRRIFGVFGAGQVYAQTVDTLRDPEQPEVQRAYAAEALGEFLTAAGTPHVARALREDESAMVRLACVRALQRLNTEGPAGELAGALSDADAEVRWAALHAATRINVFRAVDQIAARLDDPSSAVRVQALHALGALRVEDAVVALIARLSPVVEPAASARAAAASALGEIGDSAARGALLEAMEGDEDRFVRDAARVAARRL